MKLCSKHCVKIFLQGRALLPPASFPIQGCDIKVIEALIESGADKIVYISCKPSTLARDVGLLVGSLIYSDGQLVKLKEYTPRYTVKTVKPFDMFAQTKHIETLVLLERTKQ